MIINFLPGIIALGIITSFEDVRFGKIRNIWIILAVGYALIMHAVLSVLNHGDISLIELCTNFIFSVAVGFGLWYFRLWSAGDGKLFIAFSMLLPLSVYRLGYSKWIPSTTLLINIYIPALLLLLVSLMTKLKHIRTKSPRLSIFSTDWIKSIPGIFVIFWIMQILLAHSILRNNYTLTMILTIFIYMSVNKILKEKAFVIMLIISLSRFLFDKTVYTWSFWVGFSALLIIWGLIRRLIQERVFSLSRTVFSREMSIRRLRPGMCLGETIKKSRKKPDSGFRKHDNVYFFKSQRAHTDSENFIETDSITKKQIDMLKKIGFRKIRVSQTLPFAPFIFFGAIVTILVKGNLLIFIRNLV